MGLGIEISDTEIEYDETYSYSTSSYRYVPGHYEYYGYYSYRYVPGHYVEKTTWHTNTRTVEDTRSDRCTVFNVGLEYNPRPRVSIRGDFSYYGKSSKDDGMWADQPRRLLACDAKFRFTQSLFLMLGGSYETKQKTKTVSAGLGYRF